MAMPGNGKLDTTRLGEKAKLFRPTMVEDARHSARHNAGPSRRCRQEFSLALFSATIVPAETSSNAAGF
jgi:hypothetical protein